MRETLLDCRAVDWSRISPAVFGSLFRPLFLDALWAEFDKAKGSKNRLFEFLKKLATLRFLDPACGCGNFLVIAYRELRLLELEVLRHVRDSGQMHLDIFQLVQIDVDRFHGIEIDEWPARIAEVALWLTGHQMNMRVSEEFGDYYVRLPLKHAPHIVKGNALALDWNDVIPAERLDYLLGNPPFVGKHYQSREQKAELLAVFDGLRGASDLDYVACWYRKAAEYMAGVASARHSGAAQRSPESSSDKVAQSADKTLNWMPDQVRHDGIKAAFVSTNSITQGEQVGILWPDLYRFGVKIHFAHRTFQWNSEARGKAAVHCVIVGFGLQEAAEKWLFDYDTPRSEPHALKVSNINPYLADAPDVIAFKRQQPLLPVPTMRCGNKPSDGGHLLLTPEEKAQLLHDEPEAAPWLKRFVGSEEFINGIERWCLWLDGISPDALRKLPHVLARVEAVRDFRLKSSAEPPRRIADSPTRFFFVSQPAEAYILIPEVSSERRRYVPVGLMPAEVISSNTNYVTATANHYLFGVLQSAMHMSWMATVGGRLKSDFRYSASLVYNTFPWPDPSDKQRAARRLWSSLLCRRGRTRGLPVRALSGPGLASTRRKAAKTAPGAGLVNRITVCLFKRNCQLKK